MVFEILRYSSTLFEKESARPDEGGYHRRKVVYKCALGKNRAAVWLPFMVSFYLPREKLLSDSCYRFKLPQKDHTAANQ